ncbi:uncharacterized protein LOC141570015 [Rhinolophus sinicus]|uniref:uncharacterized protein LOC141570015 n=1 Tax=Rhinolophus sinicus TaxID=89399 RepID=UPI003D797ADB
MRERPPREGAAADPPAAGRLRGNTKGGGEAKLCPTHLHRGTGRSPPLEGRRKGLSPPPAPAPSPAGSAPTAVGEPGPDPATSRPVASPAPRSAHCRPGVPATDTPTPRRGAEPPAGSGGGGTCRHQLSSGLGEGRVRGRPGQPLTWEEFAGRGAGLGAGAQVMNLAAYFIDIRVELLIFRRQLYPRFFLTFIYLSEFFQDPSAPSQAVVSI